LLVSVLLFAAGTGHAQVPTTPGVDDAQVARELEAIRDQLVQLDIEAALAAVDSVLRRPGLSDGRQVEAYDLRAQAHAASDDLAAAEKDYRTILELDAAYAPHREVTSKKAMERFAKLRASMIGSVRLDLDPKDAAMTVDDRPVAPSEEGVVPVLAGERRLAFTRRGFDGLQTTTRAVAGQETLVRIRLVPNARAVVVRTDVDGVAVTLDGAPAGVTARAGGPGAAAEATLRIDDVPIGEHDFGLSKPCYASESLQDSVSVDVADRSAKVLRVVSLRPSRMRVGVTGADYPGELRVDGESVASLPLSSFTVCPGVRTLEVVAAGRVVWSGAMAADAADATVDLTPRPNAVLVGAAWPKSWAEATAGWSLKERVEAPAGVDLTVRENWSKLALPPGTDLAVGVLPDAGVAGDERTVLYSPLLQELEERASPPPAARSSWREATLGAALVDADGKSVVLAALRADGPAAKVGLFPGDRIVAVDGRAVVDAAGARTAIARGGIGASVVLDVAPPTGTSRRVTCVTAAEPLMAARPGDPSSDLVRAGWAAADAAAGGPDAALALANLAQLFDRSERKNAALDAWRRVRALASGRLAARAAYAIGVGLQESGKRAEAVASFGQARSEGAASGDFVLAAAAADRLADLGVAPR